MTIGERISQILGDKKISNAIFCRIARAPTSSLSGYINKGHTPGLDFLAGVLNGFPDLNPIWFICDKGDPWLSQDQVHEMEQKYRSGPEQLWEENRILRDQLEDKKDQLEDKKKIIEMLEARLSNFEGKKEESSG
jgi:hypothetical protein